MFFNSIITLLEEGESVSTTQGPTGDPQSASDCLYRKKTLIITKVSLVMSLAHNHTLHASKISLLGGNFEVTVNNAKKLLASCVMIDIMFEENLRDSE